MNESELKAARDLTDALAKFYNAKVTITDKHLLEIHTDNLEVCTILGKVPGVDVIFGFAEEEKPKKKSKDSPSTAHDPLRNYPIMKIEAPAVNESQDDPTAGFEARRVCRNCMRLFVPKRNTTKCCSNNCNVLYNQRSRRFEAIDTKYAFRNEHRHWFYGDAYWFDKQLAAGIFPEGSKILTPEGWLRIIRMQAGQLTFDEVHAI
jgi:hypothetical protein